jgi:hypothetical protein
MFCPQCSQEQLTEDMRFCSRCGFPLAIVSQLIASGGALEGFDLEGNRQLSPRQKGVRKGALFMIISAVLLPIVALMAAIKHDLAVLSVPVLMVLIYGLARLLYAYLLEQNTSTGSSLAGSAKSKQMPPAYRPTLTPNQSVPVADWRRPADTSEMAQPPSITDHTTRLLIDESEPAPRAQKD